MQLRSSGGLYGLEGFDGCPRISFENGCGE